MKKPTYKTGLPKNIIGKKVFEEELSICCKSSQEENGKCNWGLCKSCGVIPLLYKLHKGELLEEAEEIKKAKDKVLK